ncbi:MAG: hypothetical protein IPI49_09640 [Myxococcales bacterium]|nr:hypothetical protein [Myxococcales bacterium]
MRSVGVWLCLLGACDFPRPQVPLDAAPGDTGDASQDASFCAAGFVSFCPSGPPTKSLDITTNTVLPTDTSPECLNVMPTSGGAALCILYLQDFSIAAGVTLRAWGQRPLAIYVKDTITILGTLDVSSRRTLPAEPGAGSRTCDAPTLPGADTGGSGGGAGGSMADLGGSGGVGDTDQTGGAGNAAGGAPGLATTFAATLLAAAPGAGGGGRRRRGGPRRRRRLSARQHHKRRGGRQRPRGRRRRHRRRPRGWRRRRRQRRLDRPRDHRRHLRSPVLLRHRRRRRPGR